MKQENRECDHRTICQFDGEILMCHVIFPGTCISSHMAPKTAVKKINRIIPCQVMSECYLSQNLVKSCQVVTVFKI